MLNAQDTRIWYRTHDTGYWIQDTGYRHRKDNTRYKIKDIHDTG